MQIANRLCPYCVTKRTRAVTNSDNPFPARHDF
jgi:hypothetical protein